MERWRKSALNHTTTIYMQGVFTEFWDRNEFMDDINKLKKNIKKSYRCRIGRHAYLDYDIPFPDVLIGGCRYFLGYLRISGPKEAREKFNNEVKSIMNKFGMIELTKEEYKDLCQAKVGDGFH